MRESSAERGKSRRSSASKLGIERFLLEEFGIYHTSISPKSNVFRETRASPSQYRLGTMITKVSTASTLLVRRAGIIVVVIETFACIGQGVSVREPKSTSPEVWV
jgi:hypothetical protein